MNVVVDLIVVVTTEEEAPDPMVYVRVESLTLVETPCPESTAPPDPDPDPDSAPEFPVPNGTAALFVKEPPAAAIAEDAAWAAVTGHTVVANVIVSVTTATCVASAAGQSVTVGAQLVTVRNCVVKTVMVVNSSAEGEVALK